MFDFKFPGILCCDVALYKQQQQECVNYFDHQVKTNTGYFNTLKAEPQILVVNQQLRIQPLNK